MQADIPNAKCEVIRAYLVKNFSDCVVQEDLDATQQSRLTVRNGDMELASVQVNAALLADRHLSALELRWALKERDIARQIRSVGHVALDHAGLRIGDTGAIARWPKNQKASAQ
jgi:hypothetical protein